RSRRDAAIATMPGRTTRERTRAALPVASVTAMITINHTVAAIPATASGSSQDSTRDSRDASPSRMWWTRVWGGDVVMLCTTRGSERNRRYCLSDNDPKLIKPVRYDTTTEQRLDGANYLRYTLQLV